MKAYPFITKINHIGVATKNYQETAAFYESVGYHEVVGGYDPFQNVYGYFYEAEGMPTIELLAPYDEKSPINKILEKIGVTPYHLCYEINCSIEEAIKEMKGDRFMVIAKPTHSDNLKGRVCFLFHKDVGIVELLEYEKV